MVLHPSHLLPTIDDYIADLCLNWNYPDPKKRQISPYKHTPIIYGAKTQYATEPPFSNPLDDKGVLRVQSIFGSLLYYARAVAKKLLVGINYLVQQQSSATEDTNAAILQLLDYVATYPNNGILYQASGMVFAGHSDADYLNVRKSRSHAVYHIMLSEDTHFPTRNIPFLTSAEIIKFGMSSAAEAKISGLFICTKVSQDPE